MKGIDSIRKDIQEARKRQSGSADGRGAVTRSEAIEIVRRAVSAGTTPEIIRQAFDEAGDNGFGKAMAAYLRDFDITRLIGSVGTVPETRERLPHAPVLSERGQTYDSTHGQLTLTPRLEVGSAGRTVAVRAETSNPYRYSSGPGEQPRIYGRDGLFDQAILRVYGYQASDPLSDKDGKLAAELARDPDIARARQQFIDAKPGAVELTLPRKPQIS